MPRVASEGGSVYHDLQRENTKLLLMDPLTAVMNAVTATIALAGKVWDATPADLKAQSAGDWAKFTHNIGSFFLTLQDKIDHIAGVKV